MSFYEKYKKIPIQVKAVFWLTICTLLQKGISVITVPIFTRIMSTEDYGVFSVFISWENIIQLFTTLSLHTGVFNTAMIQNENRHNVVVSSYLGLTTLLTGVCFALYVLIPDFVNDKLQMTTIMVYLLFINLLLAPAYNLWLAQKRFEYKYRIIVIYTVIYSIVNPLVGYLAVVSYSDKAFARIIASTVVCVFFFGAIYIHIFIKGKCLFDSILWKNALKINVPLIPHFLSGTILNQADRVMISRMVGESQAGIYSVGYSAAMMLQLLISSVNASIIPWFYGKIKRGKETETRGILNIASILMGGAVVVFMLFAPECMKIFAPDEYYEAVNLFPPLTASVYLIFIYNLFCNIELYYEKSLYITLSSCVAAVVNIVLNYYLIPIFGYTAAGYTTFASYFIFVIMHYLFAMKVVKEKGIRNPIDVKLLKLLTCVICGITAFISYTYDSVLLRYLLIISLTIIAIIFHKRIIKVIRELRTRNNE